MRGRRPKPIALKLLEGNAGKRVTRAMEQRELARQLEATKTPAPLVPPRSLKGEAKKEWERLAPVLRQVGMLRDEFLGLFTSMCEAWGRYREYEKLCTKVGPEVAVRLKYRRAADEADKRYLRIATEFGLSPSSEGRVGAKGLAKRAAAGPVTAKDGIRNRMFGVKGR